MITVGSIRTTKTFWALDKEDTPREVRITPEFEKLIKSQRDQFGFDEHEPVTIYSDTVDVLFAGVHPHTIDPLRIFTTEKGARQSVKDRRKLKELDHDFAISCDQDAIIKEIISTKLDTDTLDGKSGRIMKTWLNQPTKIVYPLEVFAVVSESVKDDKRRFNVEGIFPKQSIAEDAMTALRDAFSHAPSVTFSIQSMPFGTLTFDGVHYSVEN